ncbi:MAG: MerR family transcriptional regulator [Alphaproteobacteria bacterium]|nr:MerR family transcriptional regulator [Alphaproteobacteria bacterium]
MEQDFQQISLFGFDDDDTIMHNKNQSNSQKTHVNQKPIIYSAEDLEKELSQDTNSSAYQDDTSLSSDKKKSAKKSLYELALEKSDSEDQPNLNTVTPAVDNSFLPPNFFNEIDPNFDQNLNVTPKKRGRPKKIISIEIPPEPKGKGGRISFKDMDITMQQLKIPDEAFLLAKSYHSITHVSQWFYVNKSLLRYWEKEFSILQPKKNKKGDRFYNIDDIRLIEKIYYLLRVKKYSIEGAKEYLKENKNVLDTKFMLIEGLEKLKQLLIVWKNKLQEN